MSSELPSSWIIWYSSLSKRNDNLEYDYNYEDDLLCLCELRTLQQFFNAFSYIKKPSEMQRNESMSCFRKGNKPTWESCPSGGSWTLKVSKKDLLKVDLYWDCLILECIRGGFSQDIDGIMISVKQYEVNLQVWMHEAAAAHLKVAGEIKQALKVETLDMFLKYHKDSLKDMSSVRNSVRIIC
ncbi:hypothetical protein SteCoe_12730 [Stentor coeruleus]|uniref:Uncharacterized protein n=1 Tax=Stentor coeruleus TaxID=5963 RepID=A0A1R2CA55_9CILI|nr:hypothetical protein SteCoe_12730 [Stentor coeruleus]